MARGRAAVAVAFAISHGISRWYKGPVLTLTIKNKIQFLTGMREVAAA